MNARVFNFGKVKQTTYGFLCNRGDEYSVYGTETLEFQNYINKSIDDAKYSYFPDDIMSSYAGGCSVRRNDGIYWANRRGYRHNLRGPSLISRSMVEWDVDGKFVHSSCNILNIKELLFLNFCFLNKLYSTMNFYKDSLGREGNLFSELPDSARLDTLERMFLLQSFILNSMYKKTVLRLPLKK